MSSQPLLTVVACKKELALLCFDDSFAKASGLRPLLLDILLMSLVILVTLSGLQAVGLVLMVALLVIPAAASRFWTDKLNVQLVLASTVGGASGFLGGGLSAIYPKLPSGATIVLVAASFFAISLVAGRKRGFITLWIMRRHFARTIRRELQERDTSLQASVMNTRRGDAS